MTYLYWLYAYQIDRYFINKDQGIYSIGRDLIKYYQNNARIYMDEFPEVEEVDLRVNFDTSLLMKRFMVKE